MALSGSTDYNITAYELVKQALRKCGIEKGDPAVVKRAVLDPAIQELNLLLKEWRNRAGIQLWKMRELKVVLSKYRQRYELGSSTTDVYKFKKRTHTIAASSSAGTTIDVAGSTSDYASGDPIDIRTSSNTIHRTTVSGSPSAISGGVRLTLTTALTADVASGAQVETWTLETRVPLRITDVVRVEDPDGSPSRTSGWTVSRNEMFTEYSPMSEGATNRVWLERTVSNPALHVSMATDSTDRELRLMAQMPLDDIDDPTNSIDVLPEYLNALVYALASHLADNYPEITNEKRILLAQRAEAKLREAEAADDEHDTSMYIVPYYEG